jgi:hypothetical protein
MFGQTDFENDWIEFRYGWLSLGSSAEKRGKSASRQHECNIPDAVRDSGYKYPTRARREVAKDFFSKQPVYRPN